MKPYELSRNSWHFYVAARYGGFRYKSLWGEEYTDLDFCAYLRSVAWGMVKVAVVLALLAFAAYCLYDLGAWAVASAMAGKWLPLVGAAAIAAFALLCAAVVGAMLAAVLGLAWLVVKWQELDESRAARGPGFIALAIDKVRNRTCVQIKLKD